MKYIGSCQWSTSNRHGEKYTYISNKSVVNGQKAVRHIPYHVVYAIGRSKWSDSYGHGESYRSLSNKSVVRGQNLLGHKPSHTVYRIRSSSNGHGV